MTIIEAIHDPNLFGKHFKDLQTWKTWIVFMKSIFALPMNKSEVKLFKQYTGNRKPPKREMREAYIVAGRRAGKSFITAIVAVFLAIFRNYKNYLSPGERGIVMIISSQWVNHY